MAQKALILSLILLSLASCSKYYRFDELYDKGKFVEAFHVLEDIPHRDNFHYQSRIYRVVTRLALDGDSDFIEKLRQLPKDYSLPQVSDYMKFARSYLLFLDAHSRQQYAEVISNLDGVRSVPDEFQSHLYKVRGIARYQVGSYQEAIADILKSYRLAPYIDNLYYLGMCYFYLKNIPQAQSYFVRVISTSQSDFFKSLAYFQLGEIEYARGRYAEALEQYLLAVNQYSQNSDYHFKVAKCFKKLKYGRISQKFARIALKTQKDNANAWFYLNIN
jgi:tetratricopeptide (TPR) repeat protein